MLQDKNANKSQDGFYGINAAEHMTLRQRNHESYRLPDCLSHLSPGLLYLAVAHLGLLQQSSLSRHAISETFQITTRRALEIMRYLGSGRTHAECERLPPASGEKERGFHIKIHAIMSPEMTHEESAKNRVYEIAAVVITDAVPEVTNIRRSRAIGELACQPLHRLFLRYRDCDDSIRRHVTLVDACSYGRIGLDSAFRQSPLTEEIIAFSALNTAFLSTPHQAISGTVERYLVVRIPSTPRESLVLLLQLCEIVQLSTANYHQIVVLSSFDVERVHRMITVMGGRSILVTDSRLSMSSLCSTVFSLAEKKVPSFVSQPESPLLTYYEHKALYQCLKDRPIYLQARCRHVSPKTIYTQRSAALRKFGVTNILSLLRTLSEEREKS